MHPLGDPKGDQDGGGTLPDVDRYPQISEHHENTENTELQIPDVLPQHLGLWGRNSSGPIPSTQPDVANSSGTGDVEIIDLADSDNNESDSGVVDIEGPNHNHSSPSPVENHSDGHSSSSVSNSSFSCMFVLFG